MKGQRLSLPWFVKQLAELTHDADTGSIQRYARVYVIQLFKGFFIRGQVKYILVYCMFLSLLGDFDHAGTYLEVL